MTQSPEERMATFGADALSPTEASAEKNAALPGTGTGTGTGERVAMRDTLLAGCVVTSDWQGRTWTAAPYSD